MSGCLWTIALCPLQRTIWILSRDYDHAVFYAANTQNIPRDAEKLHDIWIPRIAEPAEVKINQESRETACLHKETKP